MNLHPAYLLQSPRPLEQIPDDAGQRLRQLTRNQAQLLSVQHPQAVEQGFVLHHHVKQHYDLREGHLGIHDQVLLPRNQHDVIIEDVVGLERALGILQLVAHRLGKLQLDVGVRAVLNQRQRQLVDVVDVLAVAHVLYHVHARLQDVLGDPDVGIEAVVQQKDEQVADEVEIQLFLVVAV